MDQTKLLDYTQRISKTFARFRTFDIYDEDDIGQEIFFLIVRAEKYYDPDKGDEYTFYLNFVNNRLKILRRDKYLNNEYKRGIADAQSIDEEKDVEQMEDFNFSEYIDEIDRRIAPNLRADYLRFKEGVKIPHRNKHIIIQHIKEIVERIENNNGK